MIKSVGRVSTIGKMEHLIKELFKMTIGMVMERCTGLMAELIRDNGQMEYKITKEFSFSKTY